MKLVPDAVIRLAGNSQDGIQTIGGFLAQLAGRSAQDVMTFMTIPSTISGGPSIFQVRMGSGGVISAGDQADCLVAFYQHSYDAHLGFLRPGGVLLYDSDQVKPNPDDTRFVSVGIPFGAKTVEALGKAGHDKGKNLYVLGLLARLYNLDPDKIKGLMGDRFGKKEHEVLTNAVKAFEAGYSVPADIWGGLSFGFQTREGIAGTAIQRPHITMDGNQAVAFGLIAAGVRYGAAYPITPATSIMEILRTELAKYGGVYVQCEDEIAAVATALGFSYSGHLAVTNTSGPGLSLKMEALGWATMAEMPLLVIDVQRGGPSTGLPTSVEQSDLLQAVYGSHGDSPRVVLAAKNVEDCFYIVLEAARIARDYSTPVIVLTDQALATRIEAFAEPELGSIMVDPKPDLSERPASYKPYPLDGRTRHAPPGARIASGLYPTTPGLEHDEMGHPSASPALHIKMTARRRNKLKELASTLPLPEVYGDSDGDVLLVSWGSPYGPVREATQRLRAEGLKVGHMQMRHINPLPRGLDSIIQRYRRTFVVEMNDEGMYGYGQLAMLLRAALAIPSIESITKTDGLTFKIAEVVERVKAKLAAANGR